MSRELQNGYLQRIALVHRVSLVGLHQPVEAFTLQDGAVHNNLLQSLQPLSEAAKRRHDKPIVEEKFMCPEENDMCPEENRPQSKPRDRRALNAYRHGLTGQVLILPPEDQLAHHKHCSAILDALAPAGAMETDIAQTIADDRWRLKHAGAMATNIFAMGTQDPPKVTAQHPEIDTALSQAQTWLAQGKSLALLSLYEGRIQRRVEKNIQTLRQLQQDRKAALQQAVEEAQLLAQLAATKGESYDIELDFPRELLPPQFVFSTAQIARLAVVGRQLAEARKQFHPAPKVLRQAA